MNLSFSQERNEKRREEERDKKEDKIDHNKPDQTIVDISNCNFKTGLFRYRIILSLRCNRK